MPIWWQEQLKRLRVAGLLIIRNGEQELASEERAMQEVRKWAVARGFLVHVKSGFARAYACE